MKIGILLAAGRSTRFGKDKRVECLPDDTPIVLASSLNLKTVVDRLFVAIRENDQALEGLLSAAGIEYVVCVAADLGMGHSLSDATRRVSQKLESEGFKSCSCIVALADMPFIHPTSYQRVVAALEQGASIVRPEYQGHIGHPVGFSEKWWPNLMNLEGEQGAKDLITDHANELNIIACDDPGVILDIDRPEDLSSSLSNTP